MQRNPRKQVIVKHPDREVQNRLTLVFETLPEQRPLARVVRYFREHDRKGPRPDRFGDIQWKRLTVASPAAMLKNPAYAGAFAYDVSSTKSYYTVWCAGFDKGQGVAHSDRHLSQLRGPEKRQETPHRHTKISIVTIVLRGPIGFCCCRRLVI